MLRCGEGVAREAGGEEEGGYFGEEHGCWLKSCVDGRVPLISAVGVGDCSDAERINGYLFIFVKAGGVGVHIRFLSDGKDIAPFL